MPTIKDVAKEAGLAVGTVSRIMNNRGYISESARKKVEDAIQKLNYKPNEVARSLQKKATNTIGVIVPHIGHPYFSRLIAELEAEAYRNQQRVMLLNSFGAREKEKEFMDMCQRNQVRGIVLCNTDVEASYLRSLDVSVVNIERKKDSGTPSIECDNYTGGQLATSHLIERGCRNLIHISAVTTLGMPADLRGQGFTDTCTKYGVKAKTIQVKLTNYQLPDARTVLNRILEENPQTDGIFASNDIIAAQIIQTCMYRHRKIPEDIRIVGFDDINLSEWTSPKLTSIRQPYHSIALQAVELLNQMNQGNPIPSATILPVELIVREST